MKALLLCGLLGLGSLALAQEPVATSTSPSPPPPYAAELHERARQVLQGEDFHQTETITTPAMRDWLRRWLKREPKDSPPAKPLGFSFTALAQLLKGMLIVLLALGLAWLLWQGWQWLAPRAAVAGRRPEPALAAETLALPGAPLPVDVSAAARAAWQQGQQVVALSLLYRGAVQALAERYRLPLPESATEGECLRLARRSGKAVVAEGFEPLVRAWMTLAYARQAPADFEALLRLYARHFEAAAPEAES